MSPQASPIRHTHGTIGRLCVGGDWACANGDLGGLRDVAKRLAAFAPEPIHRELVALAAACVADPDRAVAIWTRVKVRLHREVGA